MGTKKVKIRIQQKHDIEANWVNSELVPMAGEVIVYDIDSTHTYERFKIGDGETVVSKLPFTVNPHTHDDKVSNDGGYVNRSITWNVNSYLQHVILLFPVPQSATYCGHNYVDGRFFCRKTGGNVYDTIEISANCVYSSLKYHLEQFGDHPTAELCVCKYNNIWYYALKCPYHDNPYTNVTFVGRIQSDLEGGTQTVSLPLDVPYYNQNTEKVLNSEVRNSLTTTLTTTYVTAASTTALYSKGGFAGSLNGTASRATADASGNNIETTYAVKSSVPTTYAGSGSAGGAATSAQKLTVNGGDSNTPVYFSNGVPVACTNIDEGNLVWSSNSRSDQITPLDMATSSLHNPNRLAFADPDGIKIEYSTNGTTFVNYPAVTDDKKVSLVSGNGSSYTIGAKTTGVTLNDKLRVTLNATAMGVYTKARKLLLNISTSGATGSYVIVETSKKGSETTFTQVGRYNISGWSGWNSIPLKGIAFGGGDDQTSNTAAIRLTFGITGLSASYSSVLCLLDIALHGETAWTIPSNLARTGHVYSYDAQQNVAFPNAVTAQSFNGNASSATKDASGNIITSTYATKAELTTHSQKTSGNPHSVTKSEVGLGNVANERQYSANNPPPYPVTSVAGKIGAVTLSKSDVGLSNVVNTGDSATPVSGGTTKFTTGGAYTELGKKVDKVTGKGLSTNDLTATLKSNYDAAYTHSQAAHAPSNAEKNVQSDWSITDTNSDAFIKNKPTSMTPTAHNQASNTINVMTGYSKASSASAISTSDSLNTAIGKLEKALDGKAASSHGTHVTYATETPSANGTATAGTSSKVARGDHVHPTDTSRAAASTLTNHTTNTTIHITATERTNWNAAKTHATSTHAPADAEKNVQSDWSVTDTNSDAFIKNKPTIPTTTDDLSGGTETWTFDCGDAFSVL